VRPPDSNELIMQRRNWMRSLRVTLILTPLAACASPSHAPLDLTSSEVAWLERGDVRTLEHALELAGVGTTSLPIPDASERRDPRFDAYWDACALAWNPDVRAARNELLALREDRRSAGAPQPIGVRAVDHEFGGDADLIEAVAALDLIGLLGIGPSRAAAELADVLVVRALAKYEEQLWASRLDIERARVRLAAAHSRVAEIDALHAEAEQDLVRIGILERNGREAATDAESARGRIDAVARQRSSLSEAVATREQELARLAGLPPRHEVLALTSNGWLGRYKDRNVPSIADGARRVDTHPRLRRARIDFALAEAQIRDVAASAWPGVTFAPHLSFDSSTNIGGVLGLNLPWPSSWRGRLAAAEVRREGTREAFEDTWLDLEQRERVALQRWELARNRAVGATRAVDLATSRVWNSARTRYRLQRMPLMDWSDALERRASAVVQPTDDLESIALAWIDVLDARGPAALVFEAPEVTL
jgi:hypothetical protein